MAFTEPVDDVSMQITTDPTHDPGPLSGPTTDRYLGDDPGDAVSIADRPLGAALAFVAVRLLPRLGDRAKRPAAWATIEFGREVERIRAQLAPVRTRRSLQDAYRRESFWVASGPDLHRPEDLSPVRLAYALRWLELCDGCVGPTWPAMMGPCG